MASSYLGTQFAASKLLLADKKPIGMGNRRQVFAHPENDGLCFKVARFDHIRAQMDARGFVYRLMPTRRRDDNWLEARAYRQSAIDPANEMIWQNLPRLYGWQDSDLGVGLVFDYYRAADGSPAPTLRRAIEENGVSRAIQSALEDLYAYIRETGLWMRHPNVENTVLAADGRLKLIDCLGTYNMQAIRYIPALRKRRLEKHVAYLAKQVARTARQA